MDSDPSPADEPKEAATRRLPPEQAPQPQDDHTQAYVSTPPPVNAPRAEPTIGPTEVDPGPDFSGPDSAPSARGTLVGPLEPGRIIFDKYEVVRLLGQGGMGTVWLVRHRDLDVERALKMIVSGISTDSDARARLKREARVMALFSHPNAVAVHDARMTRDAAFIEMEFVRGVSISSLMEPGVPMPLDWTARILAQLCDVLNVAHEHGIVHRDLKPSNMMLLDGRAVGHEFLKVLDFGIAKLLRPDHLEHDDVHTRTGTFIGTAPYASPDQLHGGEVDGRSDIYTVGIILYEFLTGHRPFSGPATLYNHLHTPPPPFVEKNPDVQVPPEVERVVMRCLAKNPDERPQSAQELAREFAAAMGTSLGTADFSGPSPARGGVGTLDVASLPTERWTSVATSLPATEPLTTGRKSQRAVVLAIGFALLAMLAIGFALLAMLGIGLALAIPRKETGAGPKDSLASSSNTPIANDSKHIAEPPRPTFPPAGLEPDKAAGMVGDLPAALVDRRKTVQFVLIEGGDFEMGEPGPTNPDLADAQPAHPVRVSSYYLQTMEVTNGQMVAYFNEKNLKREDWPENFRAAYDDLVSQAVSTTDIDRHPAAGISHKVAEDFAAWMGGRLPTEAEWEFAARSRGQVRRYVWGNEPEASNRIANIDDLGNESLPTRKGGSYTDDRTEQGIFDLTGNVRELCLDPWAVYVDSREPLLDPRGPKPAEGEKYVIRGGSFKTDLEHARTTYRMDSAMDYETYKDLGFRIVIEPRKPTK